MGKLVEEVKLWNTPLAGALLLWSFTKGYSSNHSGGDCPIGLLHFIAFAILTKKELSELISNRRDGLQSYVRGFEANNSVDILLSIQAEVLKKREKALEAIDVAISEGLLVWDFESGKLYPRDLKKKPRRGNGLRDAYQKDRKKAEILGKWFSKHDLPTIAAYLKVIL